jgi:transcriptional regulator with XRE-family HTH domain
MTTMMTRIRDVRRSRGLTLEEVARRCDPPTTPQTIGRLETGSRTVSVGWLERIARVLEVEAQDLVSTGSSSEVPVVAMLGNSGAARPIKPAIVLPPRPGHDQVAMLVSSGIGEYRSGDEVWCRKLEPSDYGQALNRDVLVPRPGDRFIFGRLINLDRDKLQILQLHAGARQQVVPNPSWLAVVTRLIRLL